MGLLVADSLLAGRRCCLISPMTCFDQVIVSDGIGTRAQPLLRDLLQRGTLRS